MNLVWLFVFCSLSISALGKTIVGGAETVLLKNSATGQVLRTEAKIDTGASRSSIDQTLADQLGITAKDGKKITVKSALGRQQRSLVPLTLTIGSESFETEVTLSDRSNLSALALIGGDDLGDFLVDVSSVNLVPPDPDIPASEVKTMVSGAEGLVLLALMPVMGLLVVGLRDFLGLKTVGLFTPILLSIAFLQAESWVVGIIFVVMMFCGFLSEPMLRGLNLSRVSRLAVILMAQIAVLFAAQRFLESAALVSWALAMPVIVTLTVIESLWDTWDSKGLGDALKTASLTVLLAAAGALLLSWPWLQTVASRWPLIVLALAAVLAILAGRYRGLRATEFVRFLRFKGEEAA